MIYKVNVKKLYVMEELWCISLSRRRVFWIWRIWVAVSLELPLQSCVLEVLNRAVAMNLHLQALLVNQVNRWFWRRNVVVEAVVIRKTRKKNYRWCLQKWAGLSFFMELDCHFWWKSRRKCLAFLQVWIVTFGGILVENALRFCKSGLSLLVEFSWKMPFVFASLDCHFWWNSRGKCLSFLQVWIVTFGGILVENAGHFESLDWDVCFRDGL